MLRYTSTWMACLVLQSISNFSRWTPLMQVCSGATQAHFHAYPLPLVTVYWSPTSPVLSAAPHKLVKLRICIIRLWAGCIMYRHIDYACMIRASNSASIFCLIAFPSACTAIRCFWPTSKELQLQTRDCNGWVAIQSPLRPLKTQKGWGMLIGSELYATAVWFPMCVQHICTCKPNMVDFYHIRVPPHVKHQFRSDTRNSHPCVRNHSLVTEIHRMKSLEISPYMVFFQHFGTVFFQ